MPSRRPAAPGVGPVCKPKFPALLRNVSGSLNSSQTTASSGKVLAAEMEKLENKLFYESYSLDELDFVRWLRQAACRCV